MSPTDPSSTDRPESTESGNDSEMIGRSGTLVAGFWNSAQMVIPLIGTLLVSVVIGRFLGADELGEQSWISYLAALLMTLIVQTLVRAGIQTMATARGANDEATFQAISRWMMWGQIAGGAVAALILLGFAYFSDYKASWVLVSVTAAVNAIGWALSVRVIADRGWAPVAKRRLITQMLAQGVAVVLVIAGFGITGVFAANAVAAAILVALVWRISTKATGPAFPPIPPQLIRLGGMYLVTELLVQVVSKRIEFLFLGTMSTRDELAMYSIAFMVVTSVTMIPDSMVTAVLPSLATRAGAGMGAIVDNHLGPAIRVSAQISVPLAAGVAVLGPRLITMLYGESFEQAGTLTSLMAVLILFVPVFDLTSTYWGGYGRLGIPLVAVAIGGVLDLILAATLVGPYGALGATIANVGGQALAASILIVITIRRLPSLSMTWGRYVGVLATTAVVSVGGWLVQTQVPGVFGWVAALLAMGSLLALFGAVSGFMSVPDAVWLSESIPSKLRPVLRILVGRRAIHAMNSTTG